MNFNNEIFTRISFGKDFIIVLTILGNVYPGCGESKRLQKHKLLKSGFLMKPTEHWQRFQRRTVGTRYFLYRNVFLSSEVENANSRISKCVFY